MLFFCLFCLLSKLKLQEWISDRHFPEFISFSFSLNYGTWRLTVWFFVLQICGCLRILPSRSHLPTWEYFSLKYYRQFGSTVNDVFLARGRFYKDTCALRWTLCWQTYLLWVWHVSSLLQELDWRQLVTVSFLNQCWLLTYHKCRNKFQTGIFRNNLFYWDYH